MGRLNHLDRGLGYTSLFKTWSIPELRRIAEDAELGTFVAGEIVVHNGRRVREVYVILSGHVAVERNGMRVAELGPSECFGELAALGGLARSATVVAPSRWGCSLSAPLHWTPCSTTCLSSPASSSTVWLSGCSGPTPGWAD